MIITLNKKRSQTINKESLSFLLLSWFISPSSYVRNVWNVLFIRSCPKHFYTLYIGLRIGYRHEWIVLEQIDIILAKIILYWALMNG